MATRGRPRGLTVNPAAVEDMLSKTCITKAELAAAAEISTGNLADLLYRRKGASREVIRRMADALRCQPETLAPGLGDRFVAASDGGGDNPQEAA